MDANALNCFQLICNLTNLTVCASLPRHQLLMSTENKWTNERIVLETRKGWQSCLAYGINKGSTMPSLGKHCTLLAMLLGTGTFSKSILKPLHSFLKPLHHSWQSRNAVKYHLIYVKILAQKCSNGITRKKKKKKQQIFVCAYYWLNYDAFAYMQCENMLVIAFFHK